jgi:hypothetical protein
MRASSRPRLTLFVLPKLAISGAIKEKVANLSRKARYLRRI